MLGRLSERVADGTITYKSAVKVLDILWNIGLERENGLRKKKIHAEHKEEV